MQFIYLIYFNLFSLVFVSGNKEEPETNETEYANKLLLMYVSQFVFEGERTLFHVERS